MRYIFFVALFIRDALALPLNQNTERSLEDAIGIKVDIPGELPVLTLPYGKWRANSYDKVNDIYTWKNIRFAEPPLGKLRFELPVKPNNSTNGTIQDGSVGNSCVQLVPRVGLNLLGDADFQPWAASVNEMITSTASYSAETFNPGNEDCLYLDVYVPGKALKDPKAKLPVMNWIYGGAFTIGSKEQFGLYNPTEMIKKSGDNFIWVAGNYRLGVYGWLAGKTMEKESHANIGLYDQRMVLEWIQNFIPLLGGDKENVIAMGESAGASSIMHHLVGFGGKQDPLFKRAIMMSPAYQIMWDRNGLLETAFQNFSRDAGCTTGGLDCLREASPKKLRQANRMLQDYAPRGSFGVGPSTDGKWVRQLAAVEYLEGAFWKNLDSLILSHTAAESTIFVDGHIQTDEQFTNFLNDIFPDIARKNNLVQNLTDFYPPVKSPNSPYLNETQRVRDFIRDSSFTCNVRFLSDAYKGKTWNLQYNTYPGWHGLDLLAAFVSSNSPGPSSVLASLFKQPYLDVFELYRSYLTSYIVNGDPNGPKPTTKLSPVNWPRPNSQPTPESQRIANVLNIGVEGASVAEDRSLPKLNCDFIQLLEQKGMAIGGYAPPGSPPPAFDEIFGKKMPKVMIDTVEPFPADTPPTIPLNKIIEIIVKNNYTIPVRLEQ